MNDTIADTGNGPGQFRTRWEDKSLLGRVNYQWGRWRIIVVPVMFALGTYAFNYIRDSNMERREMLAALQALVRIECARMTEDQLSRTNLDCNQIMRRPLRPPYGANGVNQIAPTTPGGTAPPGGSQPR